MKMNAKKIAKGFTLVELLVVIAIIAALAALATPVVLKQQKKAASTTALNNAKQIFLLLFEYDQEEGNYPSDTNTNLSFKLLFTEGYTSSEEIFYAKTSWSNKPDGDIDSADILVASECGFKYVSGLGSGSPSGVPLLGAPFLNKTLGVSTFDEDQYGGRAVILFNDGSARSEKITGGTGLVPGFGGADVFDNAGQGAVIGNIFAAL